MAGEISGSFKLTTTADAAESGELDASFTKTVKRDGGPTSDTITITSQGNGLYTFVGDASASDKYHVDIFYTGNTYRVNGSKAGASFDIYVDVAADAGNTQAVLADFVAEVKQFPEPLPSSLDIAQVGSPINLSVTVKTIAGTSPAVIDVDSVSLVVGRYRNGSYSSISTVAGVYSLGGATAAYTPTAGDWAVDDIRVFWLSVNLVSGAFVPDSYWAMLVVSDSTKAATGADMGAVTGVNGDVTGSVGSVATGGITATSFAAGAIDSTAAPNLDAAVSTRLSDKTGFSLSGAGVTAVQSGLATEANATANRNLVIAEIDAKVTAQIGAGTYAVTMAVTSGGSPVEGVILRFTSSDGLTTYLSPVTTVAGSISVNAAAGTYRVYPWKSGYTFGSVYYTRTVSGNGALAAITDATAVSTVAPVEPELCAVYLKLADVGSVDTNATVTIAFANRPRGIGDETADQQGIFGSDGTAAMTHVGDGEYRVEVYRNALYLLTCSSANISARLDVGDWATARVYWDTDAAKIVVGDLS